MTAHGSIPYAVIYCCYAVGYSAKTLHIVECLGELALLVSCSILVNDALGSCYVDLLNSCLIGSLCQLSVTGCKSSLVLLDIGLECRAERLVLQSLGLDNLYSLLCRLNVRQVRIPPYKFSYVVRQRLVPERVHTQGNPIYSNIIT